MEVLYSEIENKREIKLLVICGKDGKVIFKKGTNAPPASHVDETPVEELAEIEAIKTKKIDKVQIATIESECLRTGTKKKQIALTYHVDSIEEMTFEQFTQAMAIFEKMPKSEPKQQLPL